ncbi:MAG: hypothetical protein QM756_03475 [Polyangiaceae bacterium]
MMKSAFFLGFVSCVGLAATACSSDTSKGGAGGQSNNADCVTTADDVIADFKTDNGLNPASGRSGGFYVYGDPNGTFTPAKNGDAAYPIDTAEGNTACSGAGSFHTKATGFTQWGAAVGTDFVPKNGAKKGNYDASQYKGVAFWAKATAPLTGVQISFPDAFTDAAADPTAIDPATSPCVYVAGAADNCSPYLVKLGDPAFPGYAAAQIRDQLGPLLRVVRRHQAGPQQPRISSRQR